MPKRQSIEIPGFSHANPIPGASRIGNLMMSSVIGGRDPGASTMPPDLGGQIANVFTHIRSAMAAAGGSPDNILRITFYVRDAAEGRAALNGEWEKMFPDPESRPARHTIAVPGSGPGLVSCEFVAVLD
ncbi:MAG: RidA family protein [Alphaproteobacteria bacterium]|nr:RidA family protein [Alphaproteobacteria bacterium]MCB9931394.1 RidA family protein [Alphaproteobacteria bacterium]